VRSATAILGGIRSGASDFLTFFFDFLASGEAGSSAALSPSSFFFFDFFPFGYGAESKSSATFTILLFVTSLNRVFATLFPNCNDICEVLSLTGS